MYDNEIMLNFPKVLKIGLNDALFSDYGNINLSLTSDINLSMTQDISTFPVSKRYQFFNGISKGVKQISIAGIVSDDLVWGQFVKVLSPYSSHRAFIASRLENFYDNETLLRIWDNTIGYRNNLIITSLSSTNSKDYNNATEWQITFTQVKFIEYNQYSDVAPNNKTIDPYRYVSYGDKI
jgi:hypothetical protein